LNIKILSKLLVVLLILTNNLLFAGSSGKIVGKVIDTESGEPLIGVNVLVLGTNLGAATDVDGFYQIINVPPGVYKIRFSAIGYKTLTINKVKVRVDLTTNVDAKLNVGVITVDDVVVTAERPIVEFDRTSTASYIDDEQINQLPVQSLSEIIQIQAGVVTGAGGDLHFRGGREREVSYIIDGVPVSNQFSQSGGSNVRVENSMISELQVISGTFNAEYGSAQSGIINIVTKKPSDTYSAQVQIFTGDYLSNKTSRFIGISQIDPINERDVQLTLSGPIISEKLGFFATGRYYKDNGYLFGERRYNPIDGWKINAYRHWFTQKYSSQGSGFGRIPIPDSLKTGDRAFVPMNSQEKYSFTGKLAYYPISSIAVVYQIFGSAGKGQSYNNSWRYAPDGRNTYHNTSMSHFLSFRHSPANNLFYNLRFSYQYNLSKSYLYDDVIIADYPGAKGYLPIGASDDQTGFVQGDNQWGRGETERKQYLLNGDFNWQVDKYNFIKFGFEGRMNNIHYKDQPLVRTDKWKSAEYTNAISGKGLDFNEFWDLMNEYWRSWNSTYNSTKLRLSNRQDGSFVDYIRNPFDFSTYLQDKVEIGEIIVNAGVRFELYDPNTKAVINKRELSDKIGDESNLEPTKTHYAILPRFGLSFPISDAGAFHFSYGHFFQPPSFELLFRHPIDQAMTSLLLDGTRIGNPNLKPEKTISYEVGLQQQIANNFGIDVTLFYKDLRDQVGLEIAKTIDAVSYYRYINRDYGNVKGLTIALERLSTGMFSGTLDYTFQYAKGSASNPNFLQLVQLATRQSDEPIQFPERQILPLDWDQRHTINFSFNIREAGDWSVSFLGSYGSGLPYSPTSVEERQLPDREFKNSDRKPSRYNLDFKAQKFIEIAGLNLNIFLKVDNVFDHLNENSVYSNTGRATQRARLPYDEKIQREMLKQGGQFTMQEWDNQPHWFSPPRRIQLGISVNL